MPCKYGEYVVSCGHGGFTLGTGAVKHVHAWTPYWHIGFVIGRECSCGKVQHMSKRWCDKYNERKVSDP